MTNSKRQETLFPLDDFLSRPTPEQEDFEEKNYDFLKGMPAIINAAFDKTIEEAKNKTPLSMFFSWFGVTMYGNLIDLIGQKHPTLLKDTHRKNYMLLLPPNYECYLKKLDSKTLLPSYNHSQTSYAMCEGMALPEQQLLPVIFIGYTTNGDDVTGCYAVCIKGKDRIWTTDLSAFGRNNSLTIVGGNDNPVAPPIVTPKEKQKTKSK